MDMGTDMSGMTEMGGEHRCFIVAGIVFPRWFYREHDGGDDETMAALQPGRQPLFHGMGPAVGGRNCRRMHWSFYACHRRALGRSDASRYAVPLDPQVSIPTFSSLPL
jgi:hypothetical protein